MDIEIATRIASYDIALWLILETVLVSSCLALMQLIKKDYYALHIIIAISTLFLFRSLFVVYVAGIFLNGTMLTLTTIVSLSLTIALTYIIGYSYTLLNWHIAAIFIYSTNWLWILVAISVIAEISLSKVVQ